MTRLVRALRERVYGGSMTPQAASKGLDKRTLKFVVQTSEPLQAGDALIVRNVSRTEYGLEVAAVPEKAVVDEAARLLSSDGRTP